MSAADQVNEVLKASPFKPPFRRTVIRDGKYTFMAKVYYRDADNKSFHLCMSHKMAAELRTPVTQNEEGSVNS